MRMDCSKGQLACWSGSGSAVHGRSLLRWLCREPRAAEVSGVTRREGEDQDELGEAYPGACRFGREHVKNARSGHARQVLGEMPGQVREIG